MTNTQLPCGSPASVDSDTSEALNNSVFILGLHRSGTTILYEMLTALDHWNTLWAWHVACFDEIRAGETAHGVSQSEFARQLESAGMKSRGVDAARGGPEAKEEYCFILDNHGLGNRLNRKAFPRFQEICQTVQSTFLQQRPLLLKNPWDFGNAVAIRELIPTARFVFIHRHPCETVSSMCRLLTNVIRKPNAWMAMLSNRYHSVSRSRWKMSLARAALNRFPGTFIDAVTWWTARQCDQFLRSIGQLSERDYVEITYDQLCDSPNETIARIRDKLCVPGDGVDFSTLISRRSAASDPLMEAKRSKIERRMRGYLDHMKMVETR